MLSMSITLLISFPDLATSGKEIITLLQTQHITLWLQLSPLNSFTQLNFASLKHLRLNTHLHIASTKTQPNTACARCPLKQKHMAEVLCSLVPRRCWIKGDMVGKHEAGGMMVQKHCVCINPTTPCEPLSIKERRLGMRHGLVHEMEAKIQFCFMYIFTFCTDYKKVRVTDVLNRRMANWKWSPLWFVLNNE